MIPRPRLASVFVALLMLGNTGCLIFERQTMVIAFPKNGNEVRALFLYEGIRVGDDKPQDLENAKRQLGALANDNQLFYAGHWMMPIQLENIVAKAPESDRAKATRLFLKAHFKTHGEAFYLDKAGRLCLVQSVTIADAPKMLSEINGMISSDVNAMTTQVLAGAQKPDPLMDEETIKLLHKASSQRNFDWIKAEPGRISATIPVSPAAAANFKRQMFHLKDIAALRKQVEAGAAPMDEKKNDVRDLLQAVDFVATFLSDVPFSVDHRSAHVALALGVGDGQPIRIPGPFDEKVQRIGSQDEAIRAFARTLKVPFKEGATAEGVIEGFLKSVEK
jgi:hypothetical protein